MIITDASTKRRTPPTAPTTPTKKVSYACIYNNFTLKNKALLREQQEAYRPRCTQPSLLGRRGEQLYWSGYSLSWGWRFLLSLGEGAPVCPWLGYPPPPWTGLWTGPVTGLGYLSSERIWDQRLGKDMGPDDWGTLPPPVDGQSENITFLNPSECGW